MEDTNTNSVKLVANIEQINNLVENWNNLSDAYLEHYRYWSNSLGINSNEWTSIAEGLIGRLKYLSDQGILSLPKNYFKTITLNKEASTLIKCLKTRMQFSRLTRDGLENKSKLEDLTVQLNSVTNSIEDMVKSLEAELLSGIEETIVATNDEIKTPDEKATDQVENAIISGTSHITDNVIKLIKKRKKQVRDTFISIVVVIIIIIALSLWTQSKINLLSDYIVVAAGIMSAGYTSISYIDILNSRKIISFLELWKIELESIMPISSGLVTDMQDKFKYDSYSKLIGKSPILITKNTNDIQDILSIVSSAKEAIK